MPRSCASGICSVCLLSFATTRAGNLRVHGQIDNRCCGSGKPPAQPRPQDDAHLSSQLANAIGHVADSAIPVSADIVPIPAASTGNRRCGCRKSLAQPRPQPDIHSSSQSATSIGHVVDTARMVSDILPIRASSTGLLKRLPRGCRDFTARKLASIVKSVVNANDLQSWRRLLHFAIREGLASGKELLC